MNKLNSTAKKLDVFFKLIRIALSIAIVSCIVGLCIIGAAFLFKLDPDIIGEGYETVELGFLSLTLAADCTPSKQFVLIQIAVELFFLLLCLVPGQFCVKCIRNILQPVIAGEPFHSTVSTNLSKLARYCCSLGIALNCMNVTANILLVKAFDLGTLIQGDKITQVKFNFTFDLTFLVVAGIILLLSYIFRYGEELQQLSDETL